MHRYFVTVLLALALYLLGRAIAAEPIVLPLTMLHGKPVVSVVIGGQPAQRMFFDTGAQGSVIDAAVADRLHLPSLGDAQVASPGGPGVAAHRVQLPLQLGGQVFRIDAMAFDRSALGTHLPDMPIGVLSARSLPGYLMTLDLHAGTLTIERGALPPADGVTTFAVDPRERLFAVPIEIAGKRQTVFLDSGAAGGLTLPLKQASTLPLQQPPRIIGRGRRVDREVVIYGAQLKGALVLAGKRFDAPQVRFDDDVGQGLIGNAILADYRLTVDAGNHRVRLLPRAD